MSIDGKHAYRFGYLKSEAWSNLRLEVLARDKGQCQICGEESISNDAHHIWYPENIYETTERHLVTLCRPCHEFCHSMLPECKTNDEEFGTQQWLKFKNAIIAWRREKFKIFENQDGLGIEPGIGIKGLRGAYEKLRSEHKELKKQVAIYRETLGILQPEPEESPTIDSQWKAMVKILDDWRKQLTKPKDHTSRLDGHQNHFDSQKPGSTLAAD